MANETKAAGSDSGVKGFGGSKQTGQVSRKNRKVYAHAMSPAERHALHTVQQAKNALSALAICIQEGKPVQAGVIDACLMIQSEAAKIMFA